MRSTLRKILASALIAAMIACVGAGCAKKDDTSKQSSAASTASQTSGESKTEESKTEESKTEESTTEESKTEESKTEESKTEESKTEESSGDNAEAYAAIIGTYALTVDGTVAAALQLNADFSAVMQNANNEVKQGTWTIADGKISVTADETVTFDYVDGNLVSTEQPDYVFVKQNAETPEQSSVDYSEAYAAIIGTYALTAEDGTVAAALQLNADASAVLQNVTGETKQGTWAVTEGKIVVTTDETVSFNYVDGNLVSTEQPDYVFVKQNAETPEQPAENDESGEEPDEGGEDAGDEGGDEE